MRLMISALAFALAVNAAAAADPYQGWTPDQLKAKIGQLEKQVAALKAGGSAPAAAAAAPAKPAAADLKIDDFEGDAASIGGMWWAGCDDKMGTTIAPNPFVHEAGGAEGKFCGRIHGKLGANKEPWAWASLSITLPNGDLRGYKAVEFWAKGDGKTHNIRLEKKSVTDFANYSASFPTSSKWTKVTIPFSDFKQPDWGKQVDASMGDVEKFTFFPSTFESTYDFSVDGVVIKK